VLNLHDRGSRVEYSGYTISVNHGVGFFARKRMREEWRDEDGGVMMIMSLRSQVKVGGAQELGTGVWYLDS